MIGLSHCIKRITAALTAVSARTIFRGVQLFHRVSIIYLVPELPTEFGATLLSRKFYTPGRFNLRLFFKKEDTTII